MNCLWCDQEIIPEIRWGSIFILPQPKEICSSCEAKLSVVHGHRCRQCSRVTSSEKTICSDCSWWNEQDKRRELLTFNYSVFDYNEQMQKMLSRWKYRGDYVLANAFKQTFIKSFQIKYSCFPKDTTVVPIPLSRERLRERGFNQAKVLADFLPLETKKMMTRIHTEKQSKKTRHERIFTSNPFRMSEKVNKPVILVDDIYTTGTTLRHAAALLKENGCPAVYAYTLARG